MEPYFKNDRFTLYHGRHSDVLAAITGSKFDVVLADPPYVETALDWDKWPDGWAQMARLLAPQMWCWGSFKMHRSRVADFKGWKLAQEIIWEKHNGSSSASNRFRRVHEIAVHYYTGKWKDLYIDPQVTMDATPRQVRRKHRPKHWGAIREHSYTSQDGGPRLMRSVIHARSMHRRAICEAEKPLEVLLPLVGYSCPPDGILLDLFSGSGSGSVAALRLGRRAVAVEMREEQCEKIVTRILGEKEHQ